MFYPEKEPATMEELQDMLVNSPWWLLPITWERLQRTEDMDNPYSTAIPIPMREWKDMVQQEMKKRGLLK